MSLDTLVQLLISGVQTGSIYALIGLGVVLLYRTSKVLNFAHGDLSLVAAFVAFTLVSSLNVPLPIALGLAVVTSGLVAMLYYVFIVRRAKTNDPLNLLILTLGLSLLTNGLISRIWGADNKAAPSLVEATATWNIGGVVISQLAALTAGVGIVLMIALWLFVKYSRIGLAMRAIAQNPEVARSLGIPDRLVLACTWAAAAALGGAAALLIAPTATLNPQLMLDPLNKGFAAAIMGGITSLPGAVLGGYLLGLAEAGIGYLNPSFKLSLAFALVIIVLILRPQGLLGERETRRA